MGYKLVVLIVAILVGTFFLAKYRSAPPQPKLLSPGEFNLVTFAQNTPNARDLILDPQGTVLVSQPSAGKVVSLADPANPVTVIDGLNSPHGLVFRQSQLYIAESNRVSIFDYDADTKKATNPKPVIDLPGSGGHFTRTILFTPDDKLLISVGSSCNICNESDWRRAKILIANPDGSDLREFATGLRNSVFMTFHPVTRELWATDMGRDWLGDDLPPDEINIVLESKNYGWPYCYGKQVTDPFNNNQLDCATTQSSYIDIPAHSAPLGLAFIPANSAWPQDYWGNLLVAYHGSWNRSIPTGYKIVRYKLDPAGKYEGEEDFLTDVGRPVDILINPDGSAYISDDQNGSIYKLTYERG